MNEHDRDEAYQAGVEDQARARRLAQREEQPQRSSILLWVIGAVIVVVLALLIWKFGFGSSVTAQVVASTPPQQVQAQQQTVSGNFVSANSLLSSDEPNMINLQGQLKPGQGGFLQTWDQGDDPKIPGTQTDAMQAAIGDLQKQINTLKDESANDKVEAQKALTVAVKAAEEKAAKELQQARDASKQELKDAIASFEHRLADERAERINCDSDLKERIQQLENRLDEAFKACPQQDTCECKCTCGGAGKPTPVQKK